MRKREVKDVESEGVAPRGDRRQLTILPLNVYSLRVLSILEEIENDRRERRHAALGRKERDSA